MAPSLPDLIWETIFKKLPVKSQLTVCKMSLRGAQLVRAANRHVKTIVIYNWSTPEEIEKTVNSLSLALKPSMQLALAAGGDQIVPFDDYPKTTAHPSNWAYLKLPFDQLLDPETIESIVNTFSAVTDFKFFGRKTVSCQNLTALLQHPQWRHQLTRLWIHWPLTEKFSDDQTTVSQMITAINNLSTLKCLVIYWQGKEQLPVELTILAQLEMVVFGTSTSSCHKLLPFLNRYVTKNDKLKVPLLSVRALNLYLSISSHSDINLMNLAQTLPCLQAIHVYNYACQICNVSYITRYTKGS
ncbi:hypothetical protein TYRP_023555 [Tyrophagus putrescentiae]|nr:hypothetical protein TYRP_023555 [Tyrophagus putrescentiae]